MLKLSASWKAWIREHSEPRLPEPHGFYWQHGGGEASETAQTDEAAATDQIQRWLETLADRLGDVFTSEALLQDMRRRLRDPALLDSVQWMAPDPLLPSLVALVLCEAALHDGPVVVVTELPTLSDFWPQLQAVCGEALSLDVLARRFAVRRPETFAWSDCVPRADDAQPVVASAGSIVFHYCGQSRTSRWPAHACPPREGCATLGVRVVFHRCFPTQLFWQHVVAPLRMRAWQVKSETALSPAEQHRWSMLLHGRAGWIDDRNWSTAAAALWPYRVRSRDTSLSSACTRPAAMLRRHGLRWRFDRVESVDVLGEERAGGQMVVCGAHDLHAWMELAGFYELRLAAVSPWIRPVASFDVVRHQPCYVVLHAALGAEHLAALMHLVRVRVMGARAVASVLGLPDHEVDLRWCCWQLPSPDDAGALPLQWIVPCKPSDAFVMRDCWLGRDSPLLWDVASATAVDQPRAVWRLSDADEPTNLESVQVTHEHFIRADEQQQQQQPQRSVDTPHSESSARTALESVCEREEATAAREREPSEARTQTSRDDARRRRRPHLRLRP